MPLPRLRVAVLGFPSDHGQGGGFTLLSKISPALKARGGALAWVEDLHIEDEIRRSRWLEEGVSLIPAHPPRRRYRRWLDARQGITSGCETALDAFKPDVVIVASGTDRPYVNDDWRLKRQLASRYVTTGAKLVMMHQLSEAGCWIHDGGEDGEWLAWQRTADRHQFVSAATWRETECNFGFALPGEVIRNNYNVPYDDAPSWPSSETLKLAFVGRFDVRQKGLDILLRALATPGLLARNDWFCDLYGSGELASRIGQQIEHLKLSQHVRLNGRITDIRTMWADHHALVMPSRAEGLSLALVEAMLCGRPAIATLVGGTGELVEEGRTGWPSRPDAGHLADQICAALSAFHEGRMNAIGQCAGARARSLFPANPEETYVRQLETLFNAG